MAFDVVVIGGGLAGMSTGALLAHQGKRVLVLEREAQIGGRAAPVERDGFLLGGPWFTQYTADSPHARILSRLDASIPMLDIRHPLCWTAEGNGLTPHPLPGSPVSFFGGPLPFSARFTLSTLHKRLMEMQPHEAWDIPLHLWLASYADHAAVQRFIHDTTQVLHFNADEEGLSTGHFIEQYQQAVRAGKTARFVPAVGWKTYLHVCRTTVEKAGGAVRTGAAVHHIELSDKGVVSLSLETGDRLAASAYVAAFPRQLVRPMIDQAVESVKFKVAQWTRLEPTRGVVLDLGARGASVGEKWRIAIPAERILIACPSAWDPSVAPPGAHLFSAVRLLPEADFNSPALIEQSEQRLLEAIDRYFPGAAAGALFRTCTPHAMLSGVRHRQGQSHPHLVKYRIPELENLFFAGDTTAGEGELADVAFHSALHVADLVQAYLAGRKGA